MYETWVSGPIRARTRESIREGRSLPQAWPGSVESAGAIDCVTRQGFCDQYARAGEIEGAGRVSSGVGSRCDGSASIGGERGKHLLGRGETTPS